jgi:hypothetical protein
MDSGSWNKNYLISEMKCGGGINWEQNMYLNIIMTHHMHHKRGLFRRHGLLCLRETSCDDAAGGKLVKKPFINLELDHLRGKLQEFSWVITNLNIQTDAGRDISIEITNLISITKPPQL